MGDSPEYRPRSAYARPGEIDTSLVEAESLRPRPPAESNSNRPTTASLSRIPESRPTSPRLVPEWERKSLGSAHAAESRPSQQRETTPFYQASACMSSADWGGAFLRFLAIALPRSGRNSFKTLNAALLPIVIAKLTAPSFAEFWLGGSHNRAANAPAATPPN